MKGQPMSKLAGCQDAPGVYDGQKALEVDARDVMDFDDVRCLATEVLLCETRCVALKEVTMHVVERAIVKLKTAR